MRKMRPLLKRIVQNSILFILIGIVAWTAIVKTNRTDSEITYYGDNRAGDLRGSGEVNIDEAEQGSDGTTATTPNSFNHTEEDRVSDTSRITSGRDGAGDTAKTDVSGGSVAMTERIHEEANGRAVEILADGTDTDQYKGSYGTEVENESETETVCIDVEPERLVYTGAVKAPYCTGAKKINLDGIQLFLLYNDGSKKEVAISECVLSGFDTASPGNYIGEIKYQELSVEVTYAIKNYTVIFHTNGGSLIASEGYENANAYEFALSDYTLEQAPTTARVNYIFDGWYCDADFTVRAEFPYTVAWGEETTHLYAKWISKNGFVIVNGMIRSYQGAESGMLFIPSKECYGIGANALSNVGESVFAVDIAGNITTIEPGAFLGWTSLEAFMVRSNKNFMTKDATALYTYDGKTLIAYASAEGGTYVIDRNEDPTTECIEGYAFYDSQINSLVCSSTIRRIGPYAFGSNIRKIRFCGEVPPIEIDKNAFCDIDTKGSPMIQVPQPSVQMYREKLGRIDQRLANAVIGYE